MIPSSTTLSLLKNICIKVDECNSLEEAKAILSAEISEYLVFMEEVTVGK